MTDLLDRLKTALADRYQIERELGSGGMATVYLARDLKHDRQVAVKVLRPELAAALGTDRFLREIKITARLTHPHILPLLDSGEAGGFLYYVMPYIEGESLRDRLKRERQLPVEDALKIARDVAAALSDAHSHDVIHRDIKPENILLSAGEAVVADFGIARAISAAGGEKLTETGLSIGTPAYMSPEQGSGGAEIDGRSDLYSLGCVLYEMLTGHPPFTGTTAQEILVRHATDPVPSIRAARTTIPDGVEQAVSKALAKTPADRFATASQFSEALSSAERAAAARTGSAHARERGKRKAIAYTVFVALAIVGSYTVISRLVRPPEPAMAAELPRLAVLPFDNLGSTEDDYFADGITDEIASRIAQISGLRVISRQSAIQYENSDKTLQEIGEELSVAYVLQGTIRTDRAPDGSGQVRVTPQLVRVSDDANLWTDRYTADLVPGELFRVQEQIANQVAEALDVTLLEPERRRLAAKPTENQEAYDAYLKGRYHFGRIGGESVRTAIRYYEEAIAKDSTFARAYAALAEALVLSPVLEFETGRVAARTALDLDPALPEAHAALGIARMFEWDWTGSEAAFQRAIELNPNSSVAHLWYAWLLRTTTVRLDEALSEARRAAELDPLSLTVRGVVGHVLFSQHRYDEAIEVWDELLELEPELGVAIYLQGAAYAMQGRGEDVIFAAQRAKAARLSSTERMTTFLLGVGHALSGQRDRAEEILRELEARYATIIPGPIAALHLVLGDEDEALDWLEKGYELRLPWLPNFTSEPWFDDLRDHPRFRALRDNMGVP